MEVWFSVEIFEMIVWDFSLFLVIEGIREE